MTLPDGGADKSETRLYLEASRLAEVLRAAAHEMVGYVDASGATKLRDEMLAEPLALIEKARAECSEPAARQLASLLVLGARHKSARCKNVAPGTDCRYGVQCCFMHGEHDRRRDPMQHPTRLLMCPNAAGGCPRGDACDMLHTTTELETHPIRLLRQLRSNSTRSSSTFGGARLLTVCPFAAQLGIKQLSADGSVVIGGAIGTQDARMKACRFVINARPTPNTTVPRGLPRAQASRPTAAATPPISPTACARPPELLPASESEHASCLVEAPLALSPARHNMECDAIGSKSGEALPTVDEVPAEVEGADANDIAAEMHADVQRELARRLCSHIQHLIRARLANPLSSAIRVGPAGEHLVPVSAVTASFVEEQRGAVTSLTHFARGLGYTKLTSFLTSPHLKECLDLVHDQVQNQTYIASLLYQNRTCQCDRECTAMATSPLSISMREQPVPEQILRNTVRHVESLGSQLVRDRAVKKTATSSTPAISLLNGSPASPHAMMLSSPHAMFTSTIVPPLTSSTTVPPSNAVPAPNTMPPPIPMPPRQPTPPAHLMNVSLPHPFNLESSSTERSLSARVSLLRSFADVAMTQPGSLSPSASPAPGTSPTAIYEWPGLPRAWLKASPEDTAEPQVVSHMPVVADVEPQLPRLPHRLLSD